jgi:hypothetical protein
MKHNDDTIRMTGGGLEVSTEDIDTPPAARLGLRDTKKLGILLALGLVAAGVVAYQFMGGSGPTPATAAPSASNATAASGAALPAIPAATGSAANPGAATADEELSVENVEKLVKEFDGYVKARQVPVAQLRTSPFRTKAKAAPKTAPAEAGVAVPASSTVAEEPDVPKAKPMPKLTLGSIMVSGDKRWAVINGRLCSVGSLVAGCRVDLIETDRVTVSRQGDALTLQINPKPVGTDARDPDAN